MSTHTSLSVEIALLGCESHWYARSKTVIRSYLSVDDVLCVVSESGPRVSRPAHKFDNKVEALPKCVIELSMTSSRARRAAATSRVKLRIRGPREFATDALFTPTPQVNRAVRAKLSHLAGRLRPDCVRRWCTIRCLNVAHLSMPLDTSASGPIASESRSNSRCQSLHAAIDKSRHRRSSPSPTPGRLAMDGMNRQR
jgi:hypothetical protein